MPTEAHPASFVKADPGYYVFQIKWETQEHGHEGHGPKWRELELHPVVAFSFSLESTDNKPPWVKPEYASKPITALQGLNTTVPTARFDVGLLTPDGYVFCYGFDAFESILPGGIYQGSVVGVNSFVRIFKDAYLKAGDWRFTVSDQVDTFLEARGKICVA